MKMKQHNLTYKGSRARCLHYRIDLKTQQGGSAIYFHMNVTNTVVDTLCATTSHDLRQ